MTAHFNPKGLCGALLAMRGLPGGCGSTLTHTVYGCVQNGWKSTNRFELFKD
jgi:hypothetical protein